MIAVDTQHEDNCSDYNDFFKVTKEVIEKGKSNKTTLSCFVFFDNAKQYWQELIKQPKEDITIFNIVKVNNINSQETIVESKIL